MLSKLSRRAFLILFGLLFVVGLLASLGHYLAPIPSVEQIQQYNIKPGTDWYVEQMANYREFAATTGLHVMPAFFFILLSLFQLSAKLRQNYPAFHRWNGRLFMLLSLSISISGLALGLFMPFAGPVETLFVVIYASAFTYALWRGYQHIRRREVAQHRLWMLRMVALGYAPVTMRLIYVVMLQTMAVEAKDIFTPTMLAGAILNLIAIEWWMRRKIVA